MSVRSRPSALFQVLVPVDVSLHRKLLASKKNRDVTGRKIAELCSGSTGDFGSLSPGSNPGSAAIWRMYSNRS